MEGFATDPCRLRKVDSQQAKVNPAEIGCACRHRNVGAPQSCPSGRSWFRFSQIFRGDEARIREHQRRYVERFQGAAEPMILVAGAANSWKPLAKAV